MPLSTKRRTSLPAFLSQQKLSTEQNKYKAWKINVEEDRGIGDDFWVDECMKFKILRSKRTSNKLGSIKPRSSLTDETIQEVDESTTAGRRHSVAAPPRRTFISTIETSNNQPRYNHTYSKPNLWDDEPTNSNLKSNINHTLPTMKSNLDYHRNSPRENLTPLTSDRLRRHRASEPIGLGLPDQPVKLNNHPVLAAIATDQSNRTTNNNPGSEVSTRKKLKLLPKIKPRKSIDVNDHSVLIQSHYLDKL